MQFWPLSCLFVPASDAVKTYSQPRAISAHCPTLLDFRAHPARDVTYDSWCCLDALPDPGKHGTTCGAKVDASSQRDLREASVYSSFMLPKLYMKMLYCAGPSLAPHAKIPSSQAPDVHLVI